MMGKAIERLERMIAGTHQRSPCGDAMSLPVVSEYRPGYVKCVHPIDERFINAQGALFGGYISALMDDVSGHTALTVVPDDKTCVTAELSISYFRPCFASDSPILLEGVLVNQSRRSYHIEITLRRADGKLVAKAHAVQAISDRVVREPAGT